VVGYPVAVIDQWRDGIDRGPTIDARPLYSIQRLSLGMCASEKVSPPANRGVEARIKEQLDATAALEAQRRQAAETSSQ
jgi:hypothetical protein